MKIFNYDEAGRFTVESEADPDPLQPGDWLLPARSTLKQPPTTSVGEYAAFDQHADAWVVKQIPKPDVGQVKQGKWEAIKAERDRRKAGGVKVGTKWFHSDTFSRTQQMGLVMLGANIPEDTQWKTMDGSFVAMTQILAKQIVSETSLSDQTIFDITESHKSKMELSDNPSDYDFSIGWPKIYGE